MNLKIKHDGSNAATALPQGDVTSVSSAEFIPCGDDYQALSPLDCLLRVILLHWNRSQLVAFVGIQSCFDRRRVLHSKSCNHGVAKFL